VSNSLAIAAVTASLKNVLESAFHTNLPDRFDGATVTTVPPGASVDKLPVRGANLYLYQVATNTALRNQALPYRNSDGAMVRAPQVALDLHYLVTFYGDEPTWEPQRLLGITVCTFNAIAVMGRKIVSDTVQSVSQGLGFEFLAAADLADGPELVKLAPIPLSLEELSKLWSIMFGQKYVLSVLYCASVVLIDSPQSAGTALPVLRSNVSINVMQRLSLTQVLATDSSLFGAIVSGARVALLGLGLAATGLVVSIDGAPISVTFLVQADNRLELILPSTLRAGPRGLRVSAFNATSPLPVNDSNLVTFLLHPTIAGTISKTVTVASPPTSPPGSFFSGTLTVPVSPRVAATQSRSLLLTRKDPPAGQPPSNITLSLRPALPDDTSDSNVLVFPFTNVPAGRYAVRLRIDGVDSPPTLVGSPPVATIGPEIVLP